MSKINKNEYMDLNTLSKKLDDVIISESKILKKNLKRNNSINLQQINLSYV